MGLSGEAHDQRGPPVAHPAHGGEDVGVLGEVERGQSARPVLLHFLVRRARDAPVGHGGGEDGGIGGQGGLNRLQHLARGLDLDHMHPAGTFRIGRTRDEGDGGAQCRQRLGNRRALRPGRAVRDIAHRVDGFVGRPGGDEDMLALQRPVRQRGTDRIGDLVRLDQPTRAELATGHSAFDGASKQHAVRHERRHVALHRRMFPHPHVHRGGDQHALVGGQKQRRGQVVRQPVRHLAQKVGGGGCHDHEVGIAAEFDMPHLGLVRQAEEVSIDLFGRQSRGRQRRHELLPRAGDDRHHACPTLTQNTDQRQRLERPDTAADDKKNTFTREHETLP